MHNIVSLELDRPRPQRTMLVPRDGARILFFTGVRYCRDEDARSFGNTGTGSVAPLRADASDRVLDAAAH